MIKTATDLLTTIFFIALAAFLVKNYKGSVAIEQASTSGLVSTLKAVTFQ